MAGSLFSEYFLADGVRDMPGWPGVEAQDIAAARASIKALLADFGQRHRPNERETEGDLIEPMLQLLGWHDLLWQQRANERGRQDVPDFLLFDAAESKVAATRTHSAAARHALGATIVEGKAWGVALDRAEPGAAGAPATQLLRYLGTVEVQSEGRIRFGLLTDGRVWRLYDQKARSRLDGYLEIDLAEAIGDVVPIDAAVGADTSRPDHILRLFLWLFGRDAFARDPAGRSRLDRAVETSRGFEARVTKALAATVFERVFPDLANALAAADPDRPAVLTPAYRAELREAALTWLYRLLFVLYAEDRDLLPTRTRNGVRPIRELAAAALDGGQPLSSFAEMDGDLRRLWQRVDQGDRGLRIPAYNGGLFRAARSPLLERSLIPDDAFAPLLDAMSREGGRLINYRDLDVQHLGSVYERLLEYELAEEGGHVVARPQAFARKTSGSYYTPDDLVMLVIRRTVGPLLEDKRQAFAAAATDRDRRDQTPDYRLPWLQTHDPAAAFLTLRIVDPAMGSGHFLVNLVDYLADQTMLATAEAAASVADYRSPLLDRLEAIRAGIKAQAAANGWAVRDEQLENDKLVRRIILKRVIHGVDKNPMAVELAKLSLWLHTFTVGAPLSFLDHHLRCGDSLFGEWVRPALRIIQSRGDLMQPGIIAQAQSAATGMLAIEELSDADIGEVRESTRTFGVVESATRPLSAVLSLVHAFRWLSVKQPLVQLVFNAWLDGALGDPVALATGELKIESETEDETDLKASGEPPEAGGGKGLTRKQLLNAALLIVPQALALADEQKFLHWQVAFPGVWTDWFPEPAPGGFDAVIGNPPWAKVELDVVNWFTGRDVRIAQASSDAIRTGLITALAHDDPTLHNEYTTARRRFAQAVSVAQASGVYPLFSKGRPDLYQLFCEQALRLVKPDGIIGLLVPSGVIADRAASKFVRTIAPEGRLISFTDFENRRKKQPHFFPAVDSRARFAVTVIGGRDRRSKTFDAVFFSPTTDASRLSDAAIAIDPHVLERLNPNTGTAIIFRDRRDAEITLAAYQRLPVLRRGDSKLIWSVRFSQMLNQSADSGRFEPPEKLENSGYYPVELNRWRKKHRVMLPLYEGKMVQAFDHRAADVALNADNRRRQGQGQDLSGADHQRPDRYPLPRAHISRGKIPKRARFPWLLAFKDITATTNKRTMIAAIIPESGAVHTLPVLLAAEGDEARFIAEAPAILANLNAFAYDYFARQKVQSTHMSWYIVEQLPVIPPAAYDRRFGDLTAREIVAREVLALTYTAHDMAPFARDMGHLDADGVVLPPFRWDDADRRQRRARLDALYFHLYGLGRADADYILSTFPIVRRQDEAAFDGRYVTRDLILAHMAALDAGDPDAIIALR